MMKSRDRCVAPAIEHNRTQLDGGPLTAFRHTSEHDEVRSQICGNYPARAVAAWIKGHGMPLNVFQSM
eukprot:1158508-Pelagomonas_calceolata.AAC.5